MKKTFKDIEIKGRTNCTKGSFKLNLQPISKENRKVLKKHFGCDDKTLKKLGL